MRRIDNDRIDAALNKLFGVIRQEFDECYSGRLRDAAIAMCRADGKDPEAICIGGRNLALGHAGMGQFMLCKPIAPAWVDYVYLASAALEAGDAQNR